MTCDLAPKGAGEPPASGRVPLVTVLIVPGLRPASLGRLLESLVKQSFPSRDFEVIAALDRPHPEVERALASSSTPFTLRWFIQPPGAGWRLRNLATEKARTEVLVFLDEEAVAAPQLIERHFASHQLHGRIAALGELAFHADSPQRFPAGVADFLRPGSKRSSALAAELTPEDLWGGNFSVRKSHLIEAGGWNESFDVRGGFDCVELGCRLAQRGVRFKFEAEALALRYCALSFAELLEQSRITGRDEAYYLALHPERVRGLRLIGFVNREWWKKKILCAARSSPDFAFRILKKLSSRLDGRRPRTLWGFTDYVRKLSFALFLCRGFWDRKAETEEACRLLSLRVPILAYPHVDCGLSNAGGRTVSLSDFARQMMWLADWGYHTVTLQELCDWQVHLRSLPSKSVILTFDGACRNWQEKVAPLLRRHNFRATIFLPPSADTNAPASETESGLTLGDRDEVSGLAKAGHDVGAQGRATAEGRTVRELLPCEIAEASRRISEATGQPLRYFAYPPAGAAFEARHAAESQGIVAACSDMPGLNDFALDPLMLRRIHIPAGLSRSKLRRLLARDSASRSMFESWRRFWFSQRLPTHEPDSEEFYQFHAQELRLLFGGRSLSRVLEIGCGNGAFYSHLGFDRLCYRGVDASPSMLAVFKGRHPEADLVCGDGSTYLDRTQPYDLIFVNAVVQYFDPQMLGRLLENSRQMMHQDSLLVFSGVTWRLHRWRVHAGAYNQGRQRDPGILHLLLSRLKVRVLGDPYGNWFDLDDFRQLAGRHGFSVKFYGSLGYIYRFNAVLKPV